MNAAQKIVLIRTHEQHEPIPRGAENENGVEKKALPARQSRQLHDQKVKSRVLDQQHFDLAAVFQLGFLSFEIFELKPANSYRSSYDKFLW